VTLILTLATAALLVWSGVSLTRLRRNPAPRTDRPSQPMTPRYIVGSIVVFAIAITIFRLASAEDATLGRSVALVVLLVIALQLWGRARDN